VAFIEPPRFRRGAARRLNGWPARPFSFASRRWTCGIGAPQPAFSAAFV